MPFVNKYWQTCSRETYPNDPYSKEIQELLVDSYITSKNFEGALTLLEENSSFASKATYQKVAFYRGVELFIETDYAAADALFAKSLNNAPDEYFKARARYWKAESKYMLNAFEDALSDYLQFKNNPAASRTEEIQDLDYNLGYTYFKSFPY